MPRNRDDKPTNRGVPPGPKGSASAQTVYDKPGNAAETAKTHIYDRGGQSSGQIRVISMKTPDEIPAEQMQGSGQIRVISMKTPGAEAPAKQEREMPHVRLRAMSEMARAQQPQNLGNLAPPYDPSAARKRSVRDYIVWGSLAVVLASGIALAVWFAAA